MIRNLFLDAGGIILDETEHEKLHCEIITGIIKKYKPDYSPENYWLDAKIAVEIYVPSVYTYILWKNINEIGEYTKSLAELKDKVSKNKPELRLSHGIKEILKKLFDKYKIGILGQYGTDLKNLLKIESLDRYFTFLNTQEEFGITKPDPRYFLLVLEKANVNPEDSIMVGDRIDKDIIPAKMIGMKTVLVRTGLHKGQIPRTFEEYPDLEINNLHDLITVL